MTKTLTGLFSVILMVIGGTSRRFSLLFRSRQTSSWQSRRAQSRTIHSRCPTCDKRPLIQYAQTFAHHGWQRTMSVATSLIHLGARRFTNEHSQGCSTNQCICTGLNAALLKSCDTCLYFYNPTDSEYNAMVTDFAGETSLHFFNFMRAERH